MTKPYSEADFSGQVAHDRSWRLREISDLKSAIGRADAGLQRVLLRSLVTICYAHWEGAVRFSARKYLEHIALRKFQYGDLERQFLRNYFLPRLTALSNTKTSLLDRCNLVDEILNSSEKRFSKVNDDLVNTRANLTFEVFKDICLVCGVPIEQFEEDASFIDILLVKRRNAIAHGEDTFIGVEDMEAITTKTIGLMRAFGDALDNQVYLRSYKIA